MKDKEYLSFLKMIEYINKAVTIVNILAIILVTIC